MEELIKEWEKLKSDKVRWKFLKNNKEAGFTVWLDNDQTFATFDNAPDYYEDEDAPYIFEFDDCVGDSDGVV